MPGCEWNVGARDGETARGVIESVRGLVGLQEFVGLLGLEAGERVLDVGCGIGGGDFYIASTCQAYVHGIDLSVNMVLLALERAQQQQHTLVLPAPPEHPVPSCALAGIFRKKDGTSAGRGRSVTSVGELMQSGMQLRSPRVQLHMATLTHADTPKVMSAASDGRRALCRRCHSRSRTAPRLSTSRGALT